MPSYTHITLYSKDTGEIKLRVRINDDGTHTVDVGQANPVTIGEGPASYVLSNAVLKAFAASSGADDAVTTNADKPRTMICTNCEAAGGLPAYFALVPSGTPRTGTVSSTDFDLCVEGLDTKPIFVPEDFELVMIRGSSASTKVSITELIHV